MDREPLAIAPVALDLAFNDPGENIRRIEAAVVGGLDAGRSARAGEMLFLFPELTLTGFVTKNPPSFSLEPMEGPVRRLSEIAARAGVALAAGFPERNAADPARPFNTLAVFGPDGLVLGAYRKIHLFTAGANSEARGYSPGDRGRVIAYRGWRIGLALCFDIRFPPLFHAYARAGVDLTLVSSCWIGGPHKSEQYRVIGQAHAIQTQGFVASVNRAGKDPFYEYDGSAYVFSPLGESLLEGRPCALDPAKIETARRLVVRPSDRDAYPIVGA